MAAAIVFPFNSSGQHACDDERAVLHGQRLGERRATFVIRIAYLRQTKMPPAATRGATSTKTCRRRVIGARERAHFIHKFALSTTCGYYEAAAALLICILSAVPVSAAPIHTAVESAKMQLCIHQPAGGLSTSIPSPLFQYN